MVSAHPGPGDQVMSSRVPWNPWGDAPPLALEEIGVEQDWGWVGRLRGRGRSSVTPNPRR